MAAIDYYELIEEDVRANLMEHADILCKELAEDAEEAEELKEIYIQKFRYAYSVFLTTRENTRKQIARDFKVVFDDRTTAEELAFETTLNFADQKIREVRYYARKAERDKKNAEQFNKIVEAFNNGKKVKFELLKNLKHFGKEGDTILVERRDDKYYKGLYAETRYGFDAKTFGIALKNTEVYKFIGVED